MKLIHDTDNNTWQFLQGESVIPLDGERRFSSREQAVAAARQVGLAVDKKGNVVISGRSPGVRNTKPGVPARKAGKDSELAQQRRITLWLDPASITTLDQLAQSHGSRGEAVRWLLIHKTTSP
jgi:hypothetical protein